MFIVDHNYSLRSFRKARDAVAFGYEVLGIPQIAVVFDEDVYKLETSGSLDIYQHGKVMVSIDHESNFDRDPMEPELDRDTTGYYQEG